VHLSRRRLDLRRVTAHGTYDHGFTPEQNGKILGGN
jgi:hypothetical protein